MKIVGVGVVNFFCHHADRFIQNLEYLSWVFNISDIYNPSIAQSTNIHLLTAVSPGKIIEPHPRALISQD